VVARTFQGAACCLRVEAGAAQEVDRGGPDLADDHVGVEVVPPFEHGGGVVGGANGEPARIVRVLGVWELLCELGNRGGEHRNGLGEPGIDGDSLADRGGHGAGENACVSHRVVDLTRGVGVERQPSADPAPSRRQPRRLAGDGQRVVELRDFIVERAGAQQRSLGLVDVVLGERVGGLAEGAVVSSSSTGRPARATVATRSRRKSTWLSRRATPPPMSASKNLSGAAPWPAVGRVMTSTAVIVAWLTRIVPAPTSSATTIVSATTTPICTAPFPISRPRRSALAMPMATPSTSSMARRRGCPRATPSEITAAAGAKNGSGWPTINRARYHATPAATAVWAIGNQALSTRSILRRAEPRTAVAAGTRRSMPTGSPPSSGADSGPDVGSSVI
jgi:hypothetical protein